MKSCLTILFAFAAILNVSAQKAVVFSLEDSGADQIYTNLWNNTTAPHSNNMTGDESVNEKWELFNTQQTDLYIYKADPAKATGQGVVVVPGGGHRKVCIKYDGFMVARYLRSIGVTAIVVKYRLPNGNSDVPMEDVQAAMRFMRRNGSQWGVDPAKVGILGSSAGGHLAAQVSTMTPDADKPAFSILIYPVITGKTHSTHHGTLGNLLGKERTAVEQDYFSLQNRVTPTTPPTLLLLADDDLTVPTNSSIEYYKALRKYGIAASMHIFPSGGHGWAGKDDYRYAEPSKAAIKDWLECYDENNKRKDN